MIVLYCLAVIVGALCATGGLAMSNRATTLPGITVSIGSVTIGLATAAVGGIAFLTHVGA